MMLMSHGMLLSLENVMIVHVMKLTTKKSSKKSSKLRYISPLCGETTQQVNNVESVSMSLRHHDDSYKCGFNNGAYFMTLYHQNGIVVIITYQLLHVNYC